MKELAMFNTVDAKWEEIKLNGRQVPGKRFGANALATEMGFLIFGGMKLENYCNSEIYHLDVDRKRVKKRMEQ